MFAAPPEKRGGRPPAPPQENSPGAYLVPSNPTGAARKYVSPNCAKDGVP
jgi:hypothetical protein